MKRARWRMTAAATLIVAGVAGIAGLKGQTAAPATKRTVLLKQDAPVPGREVVMASAELPPGSAEGKHTHFAEVYAFVNEGTLTLEVEGQPTKVYKAGDAFIIPSGKVHEGSNKDKTTVKLSVVFFAEKDKPLVTPAK